MTIENNSTATRIGLLISYYIALSFWSAQTDPCSIYDQPKRSWSNKEGYCSGCQFCLLGYRGGDWYVMTTIRLT
jgi:hypothetical protein